MQEARRRVKLTEHDPLALLADSNTQAQMLKEIDEAQNIPKPNDNNESEVPVEFMELGFDTYDFDDAGIMITFKDMEERIQEDENMTKGL